MSAGKYKCYGSIEAFCETAGEPNYDERIDFYILSENEATA
jgi:hypothetical protein